MFKILKKIILMRQLRKIGFLLWSVKLFANIIGLPNLAGILVTNFRLWRSPLEYKSRLNWSKQFSNKNINALHLSQKDGFCTFSESNFPKIHDVVRSCNEIINKKSPKNLEDWFKQRSKSDSKGYFFNVLEKDDILNYPELLEFALSDEVLSTIVPYYKMSPQLCSIGIYYSKISDDLLGSQNFHTDGTDPHHVKCFINLSNIGHNDGPFTFIPADKTEELRKHNGGMLRSGGIEDQILLDQYEKEYRIALTGNAGMGGFVDTSRCLHYGSRCVDNPRLIFMFHYAIFADYTKLENNPLRDIRMQHCPEIREKFSTDERRKRILTIY